jgi:hypothetical protein
LQWLVLPATLSRGWSQLLSLVSVDGSLADVGQVARLAEATGDHHR